MSKGKTPMFDATQEPPMRSDPRVVLFLLRGSKGKMRLACHTRLTSTMFTQDKGEGGQHRSRPPTVIAPSSTSSVLVSKDSSLLPPGGPGNVIHITATPFYLSMSRHRRALANMIDPRDERPRPFRPLFWFYESRRRSKLLKKIVFIESLYHGYRAPWIAKPNKPQRPISRLGVWGVMRHDGAGTGSPL